MDQKALTLEVLNDLIEVNGERIWSYQAMLEGPGDQTDAALNGVFEQMITQGQRLQDELELKYVELAHDLPARGSPSGIILRAWNLVKSAFSNKGSLSATEFFDKGERALLKAYRFAQKQSDIIPSARELIALQRRELTAFYRQYKQLYKNHQLA
ncbi:DUF2383 domain-containing protein [Parapedobacter sp. DT-150]|uniref:DUF2383 domain-containing protein n=1 Tax=Parapedobacter sp. DT-150 TaxID=3396162 RepID=UPI003F1AC059